MDIMRFLLVPFTTVDGDRVTGSDIVMRCSLLILIDACHASDDRTAAEIGWVRERLDPSIDLLLIWPARALDGARAFAAGGDARMYLDSQGDFRRLVSPSGRPHAVLVEPDQRTIVPVSAASPIFAIAHGAEGVDRTIDLGDVYH